MLILTRRMIYNKKNFMENLLFFCQIVTKGYMFISIMESQWLRQLVLRQNSQNCVNWKKMVQHTIPSLVAKTMDHYVMLTLDFHVTTIAFLICGCPDLDMIPLCFVINFINPQWVPCHVTTGSFETTDTTGVAVVVQVKDLLSLYSLFNKLIAYVKDKMAIYPPSHELLALWSHVPFWDLQLLGKGIVLARCEVTFRPSTPDSTR